MRVVHSALHARHDGGVELHRGALVPSFDSPARAQFLLEALQGHGFAIGPPRDILAARLPTVLVQEGGYAVAEIGANVAGVLAAFADRTL